MRTVCVLIVAAGCAEMPASDNPLNPVEVVEAAPEPPATPPPASPSADTETEKVLKEVGKAAKAIAAGEDPMVAKRKAKAKAKAKRKAKAKAKTKAKAKAARKAKQAAARGSAGSIQLITALPTADPPRAILALPDGKEIVVKPGQMLPSAGLVVLAIEEGRVQIQRVELNGKRAAVHNETLQAPN